MKILELGCGRNKFPGAVGIDINTASNADIIHDLNVFPYPIPEDSYNVIICNSVLEHLYDLIKVMEELFRIGKDGCKLQITVPFFRSWTASTDPTHKIYFTSRSFDYFDEDKPLNRYKYSKANYQITKIEYRKQLRGLLKLYDKYFLKFANKYKGIFEERLTFLFSPEDIYFELLINKKSE